MYQKLRKFVKFVWKISWKNSKPQTVPGLSFPISRSKHHSRINVKRAILLLLRVILPNVFRKSTVFHGRFSSKTDCVTADKKIGWFSDSMRREKRKEGTFEREIVLIFWAQAVVVAADNLFFTIHFASGFLRIV